MLENPLGKKVEFKNQYDPSLLFAIKREVNRKIIGLQRIPFYGYDVWNCYEFSFLNSNGIPQNYILKIVYPSSSENIIESKSLKLYLGSFSMTKFKDIEEPLYLIKNDLKKNLITEDIIIKYYQYDYNFKYSKINKIYLIDNQNITVEKYNLDSNLLEVKKIKRNRKVIQISNLLKSNCPITNQPDWATIYLQYLSKNIITDDSLLKYIISFREHKDYHESCCEKIMFDIINKIEPEYLIVKTFFTRRGGIDINPCRFYKIEPDYDYDFHYWRQ
ncbi:MAG TPA: NADPH-dependent 7-cyano-7-deazaguanine reductase QueF [Spirochaetota bacterium]|nr:NADPH-dependent 7-cyano-7-deazaguanine reductase QueF [Spirochaetota bacterium]HOL57263.1 NADPH-dependent 7-cyano-7-deazaguanine reductase QueF [Spirochaetota bacterium]HPP04871.1 NADPH-dependent 7-cyano-7-deazaguanine reductase QueF [Spirochaetota bacterium]